MVKKSLLLGAIDIGSHSVRLSIVETSTPRESKTIEKIRYPLNIGKETFSTGKISFETVSKICAILKNFKRLLDDYGVEYWSVVATSALREAENKIFIIDQIKIQTGFIVKILSNAEERFLTFKSIKKHYLLFEDFSTTSSMFLDLGSGSISVSIYSKSKLTFSQNLKMGALRLYENTAELEKWNINYFDVLEELSSSNIDRISTFGPHRKIKRMFAFGNNTRFLTKICPYEKKVEGLYFISRKDFFEVYNEIKFMSKTEIQKKYSGDSSLLPMLIPSFVIAKGFLDLTVGDGIYIPNISLRDGILTELKEQVYAPNEGKEYINDIISSARYVAKRFKYDQPHSHQVEKFSLKLFDTMKAIHGMGERERLLLQLASILHDIGKFLSYENHYSYSSDIILASDLVGVSKEELEMIAQISKYHSSETPSENDIHYFSLSESKKIITAKLVAIIRMADALDRSHKQKIKNIDAIFKKGRLIIEGHSKENTVLEEWSFRKKSEFFTKVFGICPKLIIKGVLNNG